MRISIKWGTVFSFTFLAILAVSHAFVFWIPVWKTHSVLRYHPKKGWTPIRGRGSSGILKPSHNYNFYSPSHHHQHTKHHLKPLHHFYSTHAHFPHHHKHKEWRLPHLHIKKSPLLNLNGHHPLCPLCHLHNHWSRPRKTLHGGNGFFSDHHLKNSHFAPSAIFPRVNHFTLPKLRSLIHKPGGYHRHHGPPSFHGFSGPGPISHFPKKFSDFPEKFSPFPPKFPFSTNNFPEFSKNVNNNKYTYQNNGYRQAYHYNPHHHKSYRHHHHPKKHVSYDADSSRNLGRESVAGVAASYYDKQRIRQAGNEISHSPMQVPMQVPVQGPIPGGEVEVLQNPGVVGAPGQQQVQPLEFPKDFANFGFSGFGSGQKGHGWEGWDW